MVPLGGNLRLGVAVVSYNGRINFGLVGDFDAMPDLEDLADDFTSALEELEEEAGIDAASNGKSERPVRADKALTS
jgi:hypothetical protein